MTAQAVFGGIVDSRDINTVALRGGLIVTPKGMKRWTAPMRYRAGGGEPGLRCQRMADPNTNLLLTL
jgi:hypothetical protein